MKTSALVLTLALLGPAASAQSSFHFGPVGELSRSRQSVTPRPDGLTLRHHDSWGAGLVLQWNLAPRVSLSLEPGVLNRGGALHVPREFGTITTRLRYLELPARLRVAFARGAVRPYAVLGSGLGYLQHGRARKVALGEPDEEYDAKSESRKLELSASGGLGLALGDEQRQVFLEALYTRGFTNLDRSNEVTLRNRGLQFRLGFLFGGAR